MMLIESHRLNGVEPAIGEVVDIDGEQWRVVGRDQRWLEVVDASEPVEPEPPKPRYFAPSDLRDSFEKVNRKLERLGEQMERDYPFGGTCCRDCEWSGHESYRKLSAKGREVKLSSALSIEGHVPTTTTFHVIRQIFSTV